MNDVEDNSGGGPLRDESPLNDLERESPASRARIAELEDKVRRLEELNTALKVLLRHRDEDKKELEETVLSNIRSLINPYIEKLRQSGLNSDQRTYLGILESHLAEVASPIPKKLSRELLDLTPTELQVAAYIREGKKTREIADLLQLSENTIIFHRYNIRTKLDLKNKKKNLRSFLQSV
ncbi:MAG: helix-turn-helix transcriptional regulator [Syntrophobacteraceae bacterium]